MEINELVSVVVEGPADKEKCPFCHKKAHDFPGKKRMKPSTKVVSDPDALGVQYLEGAKESYYATAAHHLISAIQCYSRVKRLVRMESLIGYDINNKINGIGLPTVWNPYSGQNYGDIQDEKEKQKIAFRMMKKAKGQWHVGHHAFEINLPSRWVDESGEDEVCHIVSYDTTVIQRLVELTLCFAMIDICKDNDEDAGSVLKDTMNDYSNEIKEHLEAFKGSTPWKSAPYFVSERAFEYAVAAKGGKI